MPGTTRNHEEACMTRTSHPDIQTWENWLGNERFDTRLVTPNDEAAVVELVRLARSEGAPLRVVGTGHSSTPLLRSMDGFLLSLDNMRGVLSGDAERARARVQAGTKISELGDPLWEYGMSLTCQGEIDRQAIAGAIATGTHGSGRRLGSVSAALRRARIVTGTGEIVEVDESTPDELRAAQVSMGMLGVMTEIDLQISPAYQIHEWLGYVPFDVVQPHILDLADTHRNFSILWFPTHQAAVNFDILRPDGSSGADIAFVKIYEEGPVDAGPIAQYGQVQRVDRSYRIYPDVWEPLFYEMEYMMPIEDGLTCLPKLRQMILDDYPENHMPVELRFVKADEGLLSQNYGRDSAVLSVTTEPGNPQEKFFERCDALFTQHGGRPHWGKLHYTSVERLTEQFPGYQRFCEIRRQFDPDGVFLNDYLRPLFA